MMISHLLLALGLVVSAVRTETDFKPPFRDGIEYRYEWEANVGSESASSNQLGTSIALRGQLYVNAKVEDSKWRALLRIRNVSLAIQHGEKSAGVGKFVELAELDDQLAKPFHLLYAGSKVEFAAFPDDNEPVWSTNFKRSIASLLQIELRAGDQIYSDRELSLYGRCSVHYHATSLGENQHSVEKNRDLASCPDSFGRWRTFIHLPSCSRQTQQTLTSVTSSARYLVTPNRGHPELLRVESIGGVWLDPFGIAKSSMKSTTNFTMYLEKTKRSTDQTMPKVAFKDHLKFVFQRESRAPLDLKAAQNLMLHPEPLIHGQENLRRKSQLDLLNAVENLSSEASPSEGRLNMDQLALSSISYQLGSLDYANAKTLYKDLAISPNNEKLHSARNLFLDLILHSGSNAGIILLRDLIRDNQLDAFGAARLVAYAGAYAKEPSEKLFVEFQSIAEAKFPSDPWGVFHNAAVLAVASLIGKTCLSASACPSVRIEEWQRKYFNTFSTSTSFAERALYLHALHNVGYGSVLPNILELIAKKASVDEEATNDLRIYMIAGLKQYINQTQVSKVLFQLLKDGKESFRVRIASAQMLMDDTVNVQVLEQIRYLLISETNSQMRHYLHSALTTLVTTRNPCNQQLKEKAQQLLNIFYPTFATSTMSSAEYAFDFLDDSSSFGSQFNLRVTNSEFDDLPGFVAGKMLYFVKTVAVQPYSFTVRMSGMRRYIMDLFSNSLRPDDLNLPRFQSIIEDLNFAPRKELGTSVDVAFKLHGTTVMFYHFAKDSLQTALGLAKSMDFLQDLAFNMQRYATAGALLHTIPNSLGLPVSFIMSTPILISLKGSITKTKQPTIVGRHININLYGEIFGDHGILLHFTPLNVTQGIVRNRKAIFNVPLNLEVTLDIKKTQLDVTIVNPKATNAIEISSFARTIITLRPSETSYELVRRACPQCRPVIIVLKKGSTLKTETIANVTWSVPGTEAHAQVFNCDGERSVGKQLELVAKALNPTTMNHRASLAAWAYLSFIRLQHHVFIQPEGRHCGFRGRIFRSAHLPVKEMTCRLKLRMNSSEESEISWQTGKVAFKAEIIWKGETVATDRKGEIDFTYEYRNAGARNNVNVRAVVIRSPLLNINRDKVICLKAESIFQPAYNDVIDISPYTQPPTGQGLIDYVMGDAGASNQQCPTNQFRFKLGVKASAGNWVMQRRSDANSWPYKECDLERKSQNWAPGITPQTDACYRAAVDFTTLSNYQFDLRFADLPSGVEKACDKLSDITSLFLLPYSKTEQTGATPISLNKDIGHLQLNISFLPDATEDDHQAVNLAWSTNQSVERYSQVPLPLGRLTLPSTSIPRTTRMAYENDVIPSCLVTSKYIRTLDKFQYDNTFSPCYTLVTSDCGSNPLFAVFVRRTTGPSPLAVKVQVGGHTIEIIPDESGRRKEFTVRANDLEVDVRNSSYSLPEGRERFFVLKVKYNAPIYAISSPGAGLLIHYSGSHVGVFPTWIHKNQHCGLCGNFDGEADREWFSPQGCHLRNVTQLVASYTLGQACYTNQEKIHCREGDF